VSSILCIIPILLLPNLDLAAPTDLNDSHAPAELHQTFLQLRLVQLARRRVGNNTPDLLAMSLDGVLRPFTVDNNCPS
jgi:hypothetical protein